MELTTLGANTPPKADQREGRLTEVAESAHGAVDKLAAAADAAVRSAIPVIDHSADLGHQAVDKVESAVKPAEQWITEKADLLRSLPKTAAADARQYIVVHPWQCVGAAIAAGFMLGKWGR